MTYHYQHTRTWPIYTASNDRIGYPDLPNEDDEEEYQQQIYPPAQGHYFCQIVEQHILLHERQPHPLLFIPPTAPTDPFRITQYQFNAAIQQSVSGISRL